MAPITILEHAFSMHGPTGGISKGAVNILQMLSFDGEGKQDLLNISLNLYLFVSIFI